MGCLKTSVTDGNQGGFMKGPESPLQAFASVFAFAFQFLLPKTLTFVQETAHVGDLGGFSGAWSCRLQCSKRAACHQKRTWAFWQMCTMVLNVNTGKGQEQRRDCAIPELCPYVGWFPAESWQTKEKCNRNMQGGNTGTCCDGHCFGGLNPS